MGLLLQAVVTCLRRFTKKLILLLYPSYLSPWEKLEKEDALREMLFQRIRVAPSSGELHRQLGDYYAKHDMFMSAIAEYRTSLAFTKSEITLCALADAYRAAGYTGLAELTLSTLSQSREPSETAALIMRDTARDLETLQTLDPSRYQRLQALADRIREVQTIRTPRLLDIGGGDGALCLFLPEIDYVLAEPMTNALSGSDVDLPKRSFDIVVACHVLEHIPEECKEMFLSTLCSLATNRVLLLGPVLDSGPMLENEALVYRITGAKWALEHIDCKLPTLQMLERFAINHGFHYNSRPNGNAMAVFWMVFALHYAAQAGKGLEAKGVVLYSNKHLNSNCSNPNQPNDYFFEINISQQGVATNSPQGGD